MDLCDRITHLIAPLADELGLEIVRVRMMSGRTPTLQIMAERADGTMTVGACAELSRAVSALLDVEDPIAGEYNLEVSSPGIDRPLTRLKDFERWLGFEAKVELARPTPEGRKRFRGTLKSVDGDTIALELPDVPATEEALVALPFADVGEAKLILTDELIAAATPPEIDDETDLEPEPLENDIAREE